MALARARLLPFRTTNVVLPLSCFRYTSTSLTPPTSAGRSTQVILLTAHPRVSSVALTGSSAGWTPGSVVRNHSYLELGIPKLRVRLPSRASGPALGLWPCSVREKEK